MLQQILQDLWVDPAILAELDDDQKQTLFCRMREEQVRRWRLWDQKLSEQPPAAPRKTSKKHVQFLNGSDGEPWVWVMGEHPDDLTIDQILEQEALEKARRQAELEAQQLRRSVEEELTELLDLNQKQIQEMESVGQGGGEPPIEPATGPASGQLPAGHEDTAEMIYCSVDELREWSRKDQNDVINNINKNNINKANNINKGVNGFRKDYNNDVNSEWKAKAVFEKRDVLQEITLNKKPAARPVAQRVAQWERRVLETRTEQILSNLKLRRLEAAREAEAMAPLQERLWQEQERRAKEAELQIREIARRAREEHRRASVLDDSQPTTPTSPTAPTSPTTTETPTAPQPPQSRDAVVRWYRDQEAPRCAGLDGRALPQPWFHGLISRQEAESRLSTPGSGAGSFLVRLSERVWGYAISYRDADRCKHYLVDTAGGGYQFLGANQICHASLGDLVAYHREFPITVLGGERLLQPCRWPIGGVETP